MSNNHQILLKMNTCLHSVFARFETVAHPAAGKLVAQKKKNRTSKLSVSPRATPDSLNTRDLIKRQDSFRRNPAP